MVDKSKRFDNINIAAQDDSFTWIGAARLRKNCSDKHKLHQGDLLVYEVWCLSALQLQAQAVITNWHTNLKNTKAKMLRNINSEDPLFPSTSAPTTVYVINYKKKTLSFPKPRPQIPHVDSRLP